MRRGRTLGLALIAAGLASQGCMRPAAGPGSFGPGPRAIVRHSARDFGTVEPGTIVTERFEIANVGDHPLDILSLAPACRCTATPVVDRTIWPGKVGAVEVTFDTHGLSGPQSKAVRLETNDPSVAKIELVVHGDVARDVRVTPEKVFLGRIAPGDVTASVVEVVLLRDEVLVTRVDSASGQLDVSVRPLDPPQRGVRLIVMPQTNGEHGRFSDAIVVSTNSARQPRVTIPVLASIEAGGRARRAAAKRKP